jgi:pilus assembly protein CpaB
MSKMRIVLFILAGIAALAAGLMARNFASQRPDKEVVVENTVKKTDVLVAAKDLGLGEKLSDGALAWKSWPTESLQDGMITKDGQPDAMEKLALGRARLPIYSGETIIEKKIIQAGDKGFLASILPKGMRAISVAISERSSAGGFILPNDRVDVILTKKTSSEGGQQLVNSETVLTNVRVLAVNQNYGKQEEGSDTIAVAEGKTATLELSARQVEVVAQVESMGELSLALRSIAENDGVAIEQIKPILAEKYIGNGKSGTTDTLFVRYGRETYATNR